MAYRANLSADGELRGSIGAGSIIVNDYTIDVSEIEGGHRLTVKRGSQTQVMDVMDGDDFTLDDFLASDVYAQIASAEQTRQSNEAARRSAETERNEYYTGIKEQVEAGAFNGETPVRGVDYWTSADKQEVVQEAVALLPTFSVDENGNATI